MEFWMLEGKKPLLGHIWVDTENVFNDFNLWTVIHNSLNKDYIV